jgi:hypothetical protein
MDKIFFEFPLCCLAYPGTDKSKVEMIISYYIVEHSRKIQSDIDERIDDYSGKFPNGFNKKSKGDKQILLACEELGIISGDMNSTKNNHCLLQRHIKNYEFKNGKDAYCRIGKKLCFETRDGTFPYRLFAVLCAIQSIIGKKAKFKRLTKDRIRYASLGYKSKAIAQKQITPEQILLTDRQLGTTIEILQSKKFFSKFTYANRQTFFSTKLDDEILFEAVKNSKIYWATKKANIIDKQRSDVIKSELKIIRLHNTGKKYGTA